MSTRTLTEDPVARVGTYSNVPGPTGPTKPIDPVDPTKPTKPTKPTDETGDDTDSTEASVRQLAHTIRNIRTNFFTESQTLQGFDIMRFKGHDGNVLVLRPSWDALRKRFEDCIQDSLRQATRASNHMNTMSEIFGSLEEKDLSNQQTQKDLLDEIGDFVKALKEDEKVSDQIRERLEKLADDVGAFEKEVNYKVDEAEAALQAQIKSFKDRLPGLQSELQGLRTQTSGCGGSSTAKTASSRTASAVESEIAKINEEKAIAERLASQLPDIRKHIQAGMPSIQEVVKGILALSEIWKSINMQTYALEHELQKDFGAGWPRFAKSKLQSAKKKYDRLSKILNNYIYQAQKAAEVKY